MMMWGQTKVFIEKNESYSQSKKRKTLFKFFLWTVLVLLAVLLHLFVWAPSDTMHAPKLIMSTDNAVANGGQISVLDLKTGTFVDLHFAADGCDGVARNLDSTKVHISCRLGKEPYVDYDVTTNSLGTNTPPFSLQPTFRSPLVCTGGGKCYYGFGYAGVDGDSNGRILVTQDGELVKTIDSPDRRENKFPVRFRLVDDILWILERGESGTEAVVWRFDTLRDEFAGDPVHVGVDATDFAVTEKFVAVSVFLGALGDNVRIFDAQSGAQIRSLSLGAKGSSQSAFGIATQNNFLYVAGSNGVSAFSLETFAPILNHDTSDFAFDIAYGNHSIYVTIPNLDRIEELDPATLMLRRSFEKRVGFGYVSIFEQE